MPLAFLAFLLLAVAVWLAPGHRRMLSIAGFGMAGAFLLLLGALSIGRSFYLSHLPPNSIPADAAAVVWDTMMRQFTLRLQTLVVVGLVIALGAWVLGPGRVAEALRTGSGRLLLASRAGAARLGWRPGPVDRWVAAHITALRAGALVLIVGVYVLWTRPTGAVVIWLTVLLLLILAVLEFLRRGAELPDTAPVPPDPVPAGA